MAQNGIIGNHNQLPWHLPADLKHFKQITSGHAVLMGRKTYESIGKPLPNRRNIILTRDSNFHAEGCDVIHDVDDIKQFDDVFIIGGANVYAQLWQQISTLYLTLVRADVAGDAKFQAIDWAEWAVQSREDHSADDNNQYDYSFLTLKR